MPARQLLEGKRIAQGMVAYITNHPPCVGALFDLLQAFNCPTQVHAHWSSAGWNSLQIL